MRRLIDEGLIKLKIAKPKRDILLELGIEKISDLLAYYPYRYEIIEEQQPTSLDPSLCLEAIVLNRARIAYRRQNLSKLVVDVVIDQKRMTVSIFNRHFLINQLIPGKVITIIGKLEKANMITASNIKLQPLNEIAKITPVYSIKEGITSKSIANYVKKAYEAVKEEIDDFIPDKLMQAYRLISRRDAIYYIHFPNNRNEIKYALRYLKYEEFLKFQLMMNYLHLNHLKGVGLRKDFSIKKVEQFIKQLPFTLTEDQLNVSYEILADFKKDMVMNRLVQGDVGSGKTIVAVISLYANYLAGFQGVMMAPTEILAKQHAKSLQTYFKNEKIRIGLLIGSLTPKKKLEMQQAIRQGEIDLIVGTHALIQESVDYNNLGLVITDEQHRFGVKQRQVLKTKGNRVDLLMMSATPIPRTLAIALFGDMDVSTIKTMPQGRKEVKTKFYQGHSMKPILKFLKEYLETGQQCYVVCPLVDQSEGLNAKDATSIYEAMKKYFDGHYEVGLLHGRMSDDKKEQIMNEFRENKIQILVSTTVIEVGVDVSNANMMVVYSADRFGLSQLHQLRGRVGRKDKQGYCFLLSDTQNENSMERLAFLETTNDGFEVSNYDLKLRGPGEVLGEKQSGIPTFNIANVFEDQEILKHARDDAIELLAHLEDYPKLSQMLNEWLSKVEK